MSRRRHGPSNETCPIKFGRSVITIGPCKGSAQLDKAIDALPRDVYDAMPRLPEIKADAAWQRRLGMRTLRMRFADRSDTLQASIAIAKAFSIHVPLAIYADAARFALRKRRR